MPEISPDTSPDKESLLLETSTVPWHELQRLFASGVVISIDKDCDLIEIAHHMVLDNKDIIEPLVDSKKIHAVTNEQAKYWYQHNTLLWSVVIKPWVLVQDK